MSLHFTPKRVNGPKDLFNFLHECRGQYDLLFKQGCFYEKILNLGL